MPTDLSTESAALIDALLAASIAQGVSVANALPYRVSGQPNANCWAQTLDFSHVSVTTPRATRIGADVFLCVNHYHPSIGDTIQVQSSDFTHTVWDCRIISGARVAGYDLWIGRINADDAAAVQNVATATLPPDLLANWAQFSAGAKLPCVVWNQYGECLVAAFDGRFCDVPADATQKLYNKPTIPFDSSSPIFTPAAAGPILFMLATGTDNSDGGNTGDPGGQELGPIIAAINSTIAGLGSAATVATASMAYGTYSIPSDAMITAQKSGTFSDATVWVGGVVPPTDGSAAFDASAYTITDVPTGAICGGCVNGAANGMVQWASGATAVIDDPAGDDVVVGNMSGPAGAPIIISLGSNANSITIQGAITGQISNNSGLLVLTISATGSISSPGGTAYSSTQNNSTIALYGGISGAVTVAIINAYAGMLIVGNVTGVGSAPVINDQSPGQGGVWNIYGNVSNFGIGGSTLGTSTNAVNGVIIGDILTTVSGGTSTITANISGTIHASNALSQLIGWCAINSCPITTNHAEIEWNTATIATNGAGGRIAAQSSSGVVTTNGGNAYVGPGGTVGTNNGHKNGTVVARPSASSVLSGVPVGVTTGTAPAGGGIQISPGIG